MLIGGVEQLCCFTIKPYQYSDTWNKHTDSKNVKICTISDGQLSDFHRQLLSVNKILIITIIVKIHVFHICIAIKITISPCMSNDIAK